MLLEKLVISTTLGFLLPFALFGSVGWGIAGAWFASQVVFVIVGVELLASHEQGPTRAGRSALRCHRPSKFKA